MDEDEEELAILRAQRKAKLGDLAGATPGELRKRAAAAYHAVNDDEDDDADDGDDGPVVVETEESIEAALDDSLLQHFPLSFGKQETKLQPISYAHQATLRSKPSSGLNNAPQRDDSGAQATPADTPRPAAMPASGPPRPPVNGTSNNMIGPARPDVPRAIEPLSLPPPTEADVIGPPRPAKSTSPSSPHAAMIGPPRPVPSSATNSVRPQQSDGNSLIGPLRPPPSQAANSATSTQSRYADGKPSSAPSDMIGPPRPPANETMMGPPRPPSDKQERAALLNSETAGTEAAGLRYHSAAIGPPRPGNSSTIGPQKPLPADEPNASRRAGSGAANGASEPFATRHEDSQANALLQSSHYAEDDDEPGHRFPLSNEIVLRGHSKLVSAVDVDRSGSRVLTGGFDYNLKMYDFNGMKSDLRPFRELQPHDGHPINSLSFSPSGEAFLCVTGAAQAKVYDRDGKELGEFKRGDMYMRDLKNTRGHVSGCCQGQWHPSDRWTAMTSSYDGTVRVWDTENIEQKVVIKPTSKPGRIPVTSCCYNHDGTMIAAAVSDGTLQLWSVTGNFGRSAAVGAVAAPKQQMLAKQTWKYASGASKILKSAHPADTEVSDTKFLRDGHTLLTRAADDTLKVWDIRRFRTPVHVWDDLPLTHSQTRMCVSPQEEYVLTGITGGRSEHGSGAVVFLNLKTYELAQRIGMPGAVTAICWNPKINHILVGTGDRSSGGTHVLYDPSLSEKGALLCVGKAVRAKNPFDFEPAPIIHTPGALPMFREDRMKKRKRGVDTSDPRIPDSGPGVMGPGGGGKLGATGKTLLTHYLMEKQGLKQLKDQLDPREAILRHKDATEELAAWTKAYAKTQPKRILADPDEEDDDKK